jgi:hypothetical protein
MSKPLRCWVGMHRWVNKYDRERSMPIKECELCGTRLAKGVPPNTSRAPHAP